MATKATKIKKDKKALRVTKSEKNSRTALLLEDLASLETYIHDLLAFSPLPICFVSPLGVILEVNPAFEKISNFKLDEIIGEPIERLFLEEEIKTLVEETFKEGFIEGKEMQFSPKDKEKLAAQVFSRVRRDEKGEAVGYFLGLFDLTKTKEAGEELKRAQSALLNILEDTEGERQRAEDEKNKTQAIITNFTDGLLVFDREHRLILINPQAGTFFGVKEKTLIGRSLTDLVRAPELKGLIKLLGKEIKEFSRQELEIREDLILEVSTIRMRREEESGYLVVLHDVTREKVVERLKTEFVSISAHQLRTPLSAIKWTLKMLLDRDLGEITKEQEEFLRKTYRSNERMITLVNSLLNVTRIEEGRFVYKPTLVSFEDVVESVVDTFKDEAERKQIKLKFDKPIKALPKVLIDKEKITLVVQNLIDNAISYTLPGGEVVISLKKIGQEMEFAIKDTGVGIPMSQQNRIFKKFFRGANVMRLETEGTGLGLFIAKNIIEAHRGKIWFESEEGKGTTFYFSLPIKKEIEEFLERL